MLLNIYSTTLQIIVIRCFICTISLIPRHVRETRCKRLAQSVWLASTLPTVVLPDLGLKTPSKIPLSSDVVFLIWSTRVEQKPLPQCTLKLHILHVAAHLDAVLMAKGM